MSDTECYFCKAPPTKHGIHGAEDFSLCTDCRDKFVALRFFSDPLQQQVIGFQCSECGFECDVPGKVEQNRNGEFEVMVDSTHQFCQKCGTPTR